MISKVQASTVGYIQQNSIKEDATKNVAKTEKSEGLDRLSKHKAQIAEGSYTVDISKTAKAVTEELF